MNLNRSNLIAKAAIDRAGQIGINITVAILDETGTPATIMRMESAHLFSYEIALAKARTALSFRRPTQILADNLSKDSFAASALSNVLQGKLALLPGGAPLENNGRLMGAIGVSGGTSDQDVECCGAAVSVFQSSD